jgi:hypothetical protein
MSLSLKQISEGQGLAIQLKIEPDAKIMQADLGRQTSLKARQIVGPFSSQAEGSEQFVVDRFNDLSQASQPMPPGFGPLLLGKFGYANCKTLSLFLSTPFYFTPNV